MNVQGSSLSKSKGSKDFELFVGRGIADAGLKPNEMSVLIHIASWSGGDRYCNSTIGQFTKACRIGRNSVLKIIARLEQMGFVVVDRRSGRDGRNRYKYNPAVVSLGILPKATAVSQETNGSISTDNGSISTDGRQYLKRDTPLPNPLPKPITKPTIDGLVDKFGVGGGKEQSEEEQVVQLIKAQGVSGKVATRLAREPGCTTPLVRRAIHDVPKSAGNPPGMLVSKIRTLLDAHKAKKQKALSRTKRQEDQKDENNPPTKEEREAILSEVEAWKKKVWRPDVG